MANGRSYAVCVLFTGSYQKLEIHDEEKDEILQTKEVPSRASKIAQDVESGIISIKGSGQPLPESIRAYFEPLFGHDFRRVRVHTDTQSAESARNVNAQAYTVGKDIVFGSGKYRPNTVATCTGKSKRKSNLSKSSVLRQAFARLTELTIYLGSLTNAGIECKCSYRTRCQ